jgi:hypothetical protein
MVSGDKIRRGEKKVDKSKDFGAQNSATPGEEKMPWLCEVLECGTAGMLECCSEWTWGMQNVPDRGHGKDTKHGPSRDLLLDELLLGCVDGSSRL